MVSNNLGISKNYQEQNRCCLQSDCNCQTSSYSLLGDFNNFLNLEVPVKGSIKSVNTPKTLHDIINTDSFQKALIVWDPNNKVNKNSAKNYISNSVANSDSVNISDSQKPFVKTPFEKLNSNRNHKTFFPENLSKTFQYSLHTLKPSVCLLEVAQDRMVTSPLSSSNVPCNAYPLIDKKKSHTGTERSSGSSNNKNSGNKNRNKENIVKSKEGKDPLLEVKKDFTSKKKSENQDKLNTQYNKSKTEKLDHCRNNDGSKTEKLDHCRNNGGKQKSPKQDKGSDLEKVGKLLQEVLWKAPVQNRERNNFAVAEASSGGSDTGYSSRCSTPPAPGNVTEANNEEEKEEKRSSAEIVSMPPPLEEPNSEPRSQSPSACSDSSSGSFHSYRGGNNYQGHQRFNYYPHYQQKHFQRPHFILPHIKSEEEEYQRRQFEARGSQGHNVIQFRKVERPPIYQCQSQHIHQNSSHPHQDSEYIGKQVYNGRQYNGGYLRGDGRSRVSFGFNQRYHNVKNRQYGNPNFNHPNGFFNNGNIYYQTDSQMDLRESVYGIQRKLTGRAGTFTSSGNQNGKWNKDHRMEATIIPPELLNKSEWDELSLQVWNLFSKHQQLDSTFIAKMELKQRISHIIWNVLPMCRLFVVGSSLSGFGANSSDVDMCLMVTPRDLDQRNDAQEVLRLLQREFNNCGFVEKMELITAKVPILKFKDFHTKIDVDLNCNNSVGIRNTHLLNAYSQLDWRVRPLVLVVKLWAQHHHINNAKDMTISSYSLVLMVIHYLQYGLETPLLPCLQKSFPDKFNVSNHVFRMPVTERMPVFVSNNTQTLGELFLGFLEYYAHKFTYIENTISVRTGGILPTEECRFVRTKKNDSRMWKYLCIEEPFDFTNTARSVYDKVVFEKVISVFKDSHKLLKESMDLDSIFCDDS